MSRQKFLTRSEVSSVDTENMRTLLAEFPQQLERAVEITRFFSIDPPGDTIRSIVVNGMGGSAIGGDLIRSAFRSVLQIPIEINRNYTMPAHVGRNTLVISVSYSGDTEETLAAYEAGRRRDARMVVVTGGGTLQRRAQRDGVPIITIPGGMPPRTALGYLTVPILFLLNKLELISDPGPDLTETIDLLKTKQALFDRLETDEVNPAARLAGEILNHVPLIFASHGSLKPAAYRWKTQCNENGKHPAFWNVLPELDHNEIVGWDSDPPFGHSHVLLLLRDAGEPEPIQRRVEYTKKLMESDFASLQEVWTEGQSLLTRLFSLIYLGDYTSFYLAILKGVNPTAIRRIQMLKTQLSGSSPVS